MWNEKKGNFGEERNNGKNNIGYEKEKKTKGYNLVKPYE